MGMITEQEIRRDALSFLRDNTTAVIGTSHDDVPRASTLYFINDDDFTFYFITKANTSTGSNLLHNPHAAIVVGTGPEHITVQANGACLPVIDEAEKEALFQRFQSMFDKEGVKVKPIDEVYRYKDKEKIIFKLTPSEVAFLNLDSSKYKDTIADNYMYLNLKD